MSGALVASLGFGVMLLLIALRMHVGLAMLATGAAGYVYLSNWNAFLGYMKTNPYYQFSNYTLSVIPLFVLMGALAERSGLATSLFKAAAAFVGHRRGGLAMAVIGACTVFGAICGSSVATTATFGRGALPELLRYRYNPGLATGAVAVGGTLGILIPPSIILVVYCISTEQNIAKLFMAALIPGLMAALFYCLAIAWVVYRRPEYGPVQERASTAERMRLLGSIWPIVLLSAIVLGGIYGGIFTPTEGAGVGALAMLLIGVLSGGIGLSGINDALLQTAETSAMIFIILLGSEVFNAFLALSGLPSALAEFISAQGWPPYAVLAAMLAFYILLGAVMDELAMMLLTLPIFFPIISALDFGFAPDEVAIWFGILVLIVVGIGLTAPPIGLNVFVISAIAKDVPISQTYRGVLPFIATDIVRLILVAAFPALTLGLVRLLS